MDEKGKRPVKLTPLSDLSDLFTTQEARDDIQREKVMDVPLMEIHDFPDHPFRVVQDDAMLEMAESIKQFGVLVPAMVRPREDGGYELISGHRRKMASMLAGLSSLPCIVRDLSDDEAIIVMVDSNLQREQLLPSEKAKAYKMKLEAMRRQAGRPRKETSVQVGQNFLPSENGGQVGHHIDGGKGKARDALANNVNDSARQIQRFIRLTNLVPKLMSLVDEGKIGMTPAVELSYIPPEEQRMVVDAIESEDSTPSLSQAQRLRKMSGEGTLDEDAALSVMMEQKKPPLAQSPKKAALSEGDITIPASKLRAYFPSSWDQARIEDTIYKLLEGWLHSQAKHRTEQEKKRGRTGPDL